MPGTGATASFRPKGDHNGGRPHKGDT